jgi:hypothetical protein
MQGNMSKIIFPPIQIATAPVATTSVSSFAAINSAFVNVSTTNRSFRFSRGTMAIQCVEMTAEESGRSVNYLHHQRAVRKLTIKSRSGRSWEF